MGDYDSLHFVDTADEAFKILTEGLESIEKDALGSPSKKRRVGPQAKKRAIRRVLDPCGKRVFRSRRLSSAGFFQKNENLVRTIVRSSLKSLLHSHTENFKSFQIKNFSKHLSRSILPGLSPCSL